MLFGRCYHCQFHTVLASRGDTVIGATVFYVTALAPLIPGASFEPLAPEQIEAHKRDTLRTVRLLLGIAESAPARKKAAPRTKKKAR